MALDTYSGLKTSIADFLNRDDLGTTTETFITLAEAQMQRDVNHWRREKRATVTLDSQYTELPTDFYQPMRLHIQGQDRPLEPMSINEMQRMRDGNEDTAGVPGYYALTGGEIEVWPTPDDSYTLEMEYVRTIPVLSDSNTSNWLLDEAPDVYLYGSLIQSAPYLKDDARTQIWASFYQSAVRELNRTSDNAKFGANLRLRVNQFWG